MISAFRERITVMKKILSVIFAIIIIIAALPWVCAVSLDEGKDALRAQWSRGQGPSASGYSIDYSYFAPEKRNGVRYPLFIFMAGAGEGQYAGKELTANEFCNWSSEDFQSRVSDAGGAYLLILRSPEPILFDTLPAESTMAAIKDFVSKHKDIDTSRIYATGWCIGAVGVKRMAVSYPGYFAGICLVSPRCTISESDAKTLSTTAVWLFGCVKDSYSVYSLYTEPSWNNIKAAASDKTKIRLTKAETAPNAQLLLYHHMWRLLEYDFSGGVKNDYTGLSTINGNGTAINSVSAVSWLSSVYNFYSPASDSGSGSDDSGSSSSSASVFAKLIDFFKMILKFFSSLFG